MTTTTTSELTPNAITVLERRYLAKDKDGKVTETPDQMWRRVAWNLAQADCEYGANIEDVRAGTFQEFYEMMASLECLPNSPTLMNAGRELQQLSACFVLPVEDDLESIFERVKQTAIIHKSGGGTGFSFSRLRPIGDLVGSTGGVASGPVSFIGAFDAATDVVKQGGTRRGANMAILRIDHPDIMAFIKSKADGTSLQNFNISVAVTDAFMEALRDNTPCAVINPRTGERIGSQYASEVWQSIIANAHATGDPGLVFIDRINADNPNPHLGDIESVNPCGEQPLLPYESCNLASINLAKMVCILAHNTPEVDWGKLARTVKTTVHMLDNVIDMNRYPLPEIEEMSKKTRRIGLGVMGWADMLIQLGIRYDSEEALALAEEVMGFIQRETHLASNQLGSKRGCYPAWVEEGFYQDAAMRNTAPTTIAPTGTISIIAGCSSGIEPLYALSYTRNVMDNTELMEVNPAFKQAMDVEGMNVEGMDPAAKMRTIAADWSLVGSKRVPEHIRNIFRTSHEIAPEWHVRMQAAFQQHTDNAVSKTINLPSTATVEDVEQAYLLAYELGCKGITVYRDGSHDHQVLSTGKNGHVEFNDGAELSFNEGTSFWEPPSYELTNGTGANEESMIGIGDAAAEITFEPTLSGAGTSADPLIKHADITSLPTDGKAGQVRVWVDGQWLWKDQETLSPKVDITRETRRRPAAMKGVTELVKTGHGNMYVTINFDDTGKPFEVFGNLGKAGGCDSAQLEATSRMVSMALRSGIEADAIVKQLRGVTCCPIWDDGVMVKSVSDALALVLSRHLESVAGGVMQTNIVYFPCIRCGRRCKSKLELSDHECEDTKRQAFVICPDCSSPTIHEEGCIRCTSPSCGWSRC